MEIKSKLSVSGAVPDLELKLHYGGTSYLGLFAKSERLGKFFSENAPLKRDEDGNFSGKRFVETVPIIGQCWGVPREISEKYSMSHGVSLARQRGEGLYGDDILNLAWLRHIDLQKGINVNFRGLFTDGMMERFKQTLSGFIKDFHQNHLIITEVELDFYLIERGV